ncbi:MAG: mechanosensitive ion channel family protein [Bacteroidota bacterium]|nr:mechanosensitive ion channel family protein [Bacteroidota bacterium]
MIFFDNLNNNLHPLLWIAIVFFGSILLGSLVKYTITFFLRTYTQKKESLFTRSLLQHLSSPLAIFIPVLFLAIGFSSIVITVHIHFINKIIQVLLIISFAWLLIRFVYVLEDLVYIEFEVNKADNFRERKVRTQLQFIKKLIIIIIVIITISLLLLSFENVRRLGAGLLTGAGVAGIIIGFAAQKSLANLLAGFQIAFTQPIRIDDVLVVENEWGRVEEINLTYVVLRIWDQRRLILPITYFVETPFQNWTRTTAELLGTVFLYLDYTVPVQEIREELKRIVSGSEWWDKKVVALQVTNTTAESVELRALMSASNSSAAFDLRCLVREKLIDYVQKNYPDSLPKMRAEISGHANKGNDI